MPLSINYFIILLTQRKEVVKSQGIGRDEEDKGYGCST